LSLEGVSLEGEEGLLESFDFVASLVPTESVAEALSYT
jgi:hypothetical protein